MKRPGKRQIAKIPGNLIIRDTRLAALAELEDLESVGGTIEISGNRMLPALKFPKLRSAGAIDIHDNGRLTEVQLPALAQVHGVFNFSFNNQVQALNLPALKSIGKGLVVVKNHALSKLSLPHLTQLGEVPSIEIRSNPLLPHERTRDWVDGFRNVFLDFFRGLKFEESPGSVYYGVFPPSRRQAPPAADLATPTAF